MIPMAFTEPHDGIGLLRLGITIPVHRLPLVILIITEEWRCAIAVMRIAVPYKALRVGVVVLVGKILENIYLAAGSHMA
jgi:hypothetical protein